MGLPETGRDFIHANTKNTSFDRRGALWQVWLDDQWDRAWQGFALFESRPETFTRPLDITQIALICALGYADFRFADCGWRRAFPKTAAFHEKMMQRPSVKDTVPPPA